MWPLVQRLGRLGYLVHLKAHRDARDETVPMQLEGTQVMSGTEARMGRSEIIRTEGTV